jgi:NTE family protein
MAPKTQAGTRVGLVLGAGGTLGGAWLAGALSAVADGLDLPPGDAEVLVGTSAGSAIAALAAGGMDPAYLAAYACGGPLDGLEPGAELPADAAERREEAIGFRLARALPPIGPGSWRMALRSLTRPHRTPPAALLAGWLPRGAICSKPLRDGLRHLLGEQDWPARPRLHVVACDYATGRRVAFGAPDAPPARLPDAVAASCAIPGFYHPISIAGRSYVDGGVWSASNLDLLAGAGLDLVVCLNPISSDASPRRRSPADLLAAAMRADAGRRLRREAEVLRAAGTEVLLVQPGAAELDLMGLNLMRREGRQELAESAARTVLRELRSGAAAAPARAILRRGRGRGRGGARRAPAARSGAPPDRPPARPDGRRRAAR